MIIDIHCHATTGPISGVIPKKATPDVILAEMKKHAISRTVLLATPVPGGMIEVSNQKLLEMAGGKPEFIMFGSLDFEEDPDSEIDRLFGLAQSQMIFGIKLYTGYQKVDLGSQRFLRIADIARQHGIPLMFHTGWVYGGYGPHARPLLPETYDPAGLRKAIMENPDIIFILSHMGNPHIEETIALCSSFPNVYADTSGLVDSFDGRDEMDEAVGVVRRFLEECGADRLIFGTDFPVETHEDAIYVVEEAMTGYPEADRKKVFFENAAGVLGIDLP